MARKTRFSKGLNNITLYGTTTLDSSATLGGSQTHSAAKLDAMVSGVASGDTTYDGLKIAAGHCAVTGSREVETGLTTVVSGGANVANVLRKQTGEGTSGPTFADCRIRKIAGPLPTGITASQMKVIVSNRTASVEATAAASVDWWAIGT
jgi:hypothetical protein